MFTVAAFDTSPDMLTRATEGVNGENCKVEDELLIAGVIAGQFASAPSVEKLAMACRTFFASTFVQPGCARNVRPFVCALIASKVNAAKPTGPLDDSIGRWASHIPRCLDVFLETTHDRVSTQRNEVCTLAAILVYAREDFAFKRLDAMVDGVWPRMGTARKRMVKVSMLCYAIDAPTPPFPSRYLFGGPVQNIDFLWRYTITQKPFNNFLEDVIGNFEKLSDELTCVCAITLECVRQAGDGIPARSLDAVFHMAAKSYVLAVGDDPLLSVPFARLRIGLAAFDVLHRPDILVSIDLDTIPCADRLPDVIAMARERQTVAMASPCVVTMDVHRQETTSASSKAVAKCVSAAISNVKRALANDAKVARKRSKRLTRRLKKGSTSYETTSYEPVECDGDVESDDEAIQSDPVVVELESSVETLNIEPASTTVEVEHHSSLECIVCMEEAPRRAVLSCGCARTCVDCAHNMLGRELRCPVCRKSGVEITMTIFV
jgi:hypothetical protein